MKFENTEVWGFEHAIRGMRNPKNSWDKSDSVKCSYGVDCDYCNYDFRKCNQYYIGENDLKLMQNLIKAGAEHRKFMRQIFLSVDITAPMYFYFEFDTYKVGTVANSTSKMHKIATTPITLDCFETDDIEDFEIDDLIDSIKKCEKYRTLYLETKKKKYWKALIRQLPESWLQTRTITMNYENLLAICSKGQRRFHKLNEWSGIDNSSLSNFISWARTLPYAQELIFLDEIN